MNHAVRLLTAGIEGDMVPLSPEGATSTKGRVMSLVAVLLLLLGQPPSGEIANTGVHPDSGGIPTTPPPPPPKPFPSLPNPQ